MCILVVDDEAPVRSMLLAFFEDVQYEAIGAPNGRTALECLHENPERYDLVLLDVMMPFLSGWDVLMAMQSDPTLADIPIVMMTAGANVRQHALELGAVGYLSKPVDFDVLQRIVEEYYPNAEQAGA